MSLRERYPPGPEIIVGRGRSLIIRQDILVTDGLLGGLASN
jgi:hypothetical protein